MLYVTILHLITDARIDGLQWDNKGSVRMPRNIGQPENFRKTTFRCRNGTGAFHKEVWEELESSATLVVVFYEGVDSDFAVLPHGNSKRRTPFVRTRPSTIAELKEAKSLPKTVYVNSCLKGKKQLC